MYSLKLNVNKTLELSAKINYIYIHINIIHLYLFNSVGRLQ